MPARPKAAPLSPRAAADLREAIAWIARDNPAAARTLRATVADAARRIGEHPGIGPSRAELGDFRFLSLRGFPYVLFYEPEPAPRILRVLHAARDLPDLLAGLAD